MKDDEEDDDDADIFKITSVAGVRPRKEPNRFKPNNSDGEESDSSGGGSAVGARNSPAAPKFEFDDAHRKRADTIEVGTRVSVYWGGDQEYYPGTVTKQRNCRKKKFFFEYDDGESEWIDFHRNKFHILSAPKLCGRKRKAVGDNEPSSDEPRRRKSTDSETDPSNLIRNRMDMVDVMSKIKVGSRVEVFWSDDDAYYPGTIAKLRNILTSTKPFFLEYDDGESEWIDLRDHVFRMIK